MILYKVKGLSKLGIYGFCSFPFIVIDEDAPRTTIEHERVHYRQQERWYRKGFIFGLLAFHLLYMFCLPFLWNPWRRKWETEAYRIGHGYTDYQINFILKQWPYWLRW